MQFVSNLNLVKILLFLKILHTDVMHMILDFRLRSYDSRPGHAAIMVLNTMPKSILAE